MKKALVLVLSLALALCLAIPALAADDVVIYDFSDAIDAEDTLSLIHISEPTRPY